jgi:hypothetical protein
MWNGIRTDLPIHCQNRKKKRMNRELFVDEIIEIENCIYEPKELHNGKYD